MKVRIEVEFEVTFETTAKIVMDRLWEVAMPTNDTTMHVYIDDERHWRFRRVPGQ